MLLLAPLPDTMRIITLWPARWPGAPLATITTSTRRRSLLHAPISRRRQLLHTTDQVRPHGNRVVLGRSGRKVLSCLETASGPSQPARSSHLAIENRVGEPSASRTQDASSLATTPHVALVSGGHWPQAARLCWEIALRMALRAPSDASSMGSLRDHLNAARGSPFKISY